MAAKFIELTIVRDTTSELSAERKGLIRISQIQSIVDVSKEIYGYKTHLSLSEENDVLCGEDLSFNLRGRRSIYAMEDYKTIRKIMDNNEDEGIFNLIKSSL